MVHSLYSRVRLPVVSLLPHVEVGPNDHREKAPFFTRITIFFSASRSRSDHFNNFGQIMVCICLPQLILNIYTTVSVSSLFYRTSDFLNTIRIFFSIYSLFKISTTNLSRQSWPLKEMVGLISPD